MVRVANIGTFKSFQRSQTLLFRCDLATNNEEEKKQNKPVWILINCFQTPNSPEFFCILGLHVGFFVPVWEWRTVHKVRER